MSIDDIWTTFAIIAMTIVGGILLRLIWVSMCEQAKLKKEAEDFKAQVRAVSNEVRALRSSAEKLTPVDAGTRPNDTLNDR